KNQINGEVGKVNVISAYHAEDADTHLTPCSSIVAVPVCGAFSCSCVDEEVKDHVLQEAPQNLTTDTHKISSAPISRVAFQRKTKYWDLLTVGWHFAVGSAEIRRRGNSYPFFNTQPRETGKMAQWVKLLLDKHEDLSSGSKI
ncbi:hypothetical protein STEG23_001404, partial [Scotinomys teguina]